MNQHLVVVLNQLEMLLHELSCLGKFKDQSVPLAQYQTYTVSARVTHSWSRHCRDAVIRIPVATC